MDDAYIAGRAADVRDIGERILKHLGNFSKTSNSGYKPGTIIIADDLSPSDTITMDIKHVVGFATRAGSKTSHTAIIAKAKGIPAVAGCLQLIELVKNGDDVIVDGVTGAIFVNPDKEAINEHVKKKTAYAAHKELLKTLKDKPSATTDGVKIMLSANISGADDMDAVHENGGEGVGLLRTELLFMNRDSFPSENEQFEFYKQAALKARSKPVIVRTIDIGGDKQLPYFNIPPELNPFLGYRAMRICLDRTDLFNTQLKAILRASVFGDLRIMFPMIANVQEIRAAKKILEEAKKELLAEKIDFNPTIKIGIMIEIPSAAITADILAREVDFFSIGTNDLCQYTLAVDRMNDKITHLYDPFNPGVLRLISNVIEQGRKYNVHVGMCGEMAGDPLATLLLLGMGLSDFSMSPHAIPVIKNIIINNSIENARQICAEVLQMDNSDSIKTYLTQLTT
jgi:phosphotransferase system enzyme I (PtsI)